MMNEQFYGNIRKIDFIEKYNRYNFYLKETFKKESEESGRSPEKVIEKRCFGTNLFLSNYSKYTKEKDDIVFIRCNKKISKKTFCSIHDELCTHLNTVNHDHEKLFSPNLIFHFDKLIHKHRSIKKYINSCMKKQIYRIDVIILFFSLKYDIFIRKERNAVCYHFTKDEGHQKALEIRIDLLNMMTEYLNLNEYKDLSPYDCCKYLTYLSDNYYLVLIFTLNISFKYFDQLDIVKSNEYILSDLFDIIRKSSKTSESQSESSSSSKISNAHSLIDIIVFENEKYFIENIYPKNKFVEYFIEKNKNTILENSSLEILSIPNSVSKIQSISNIFEHLEDDKFIELEIIDSPQYLEEEDTILTIPLKSKSKKKKKRSKNIAIQKQLIVPEIKLDIPEIDFESLLIEKYRNLRVNVIERLVLFEEIDKIHSGRSNLRGSLEITFGKLYTSPYIEEIKYQKGVAMNEYSRESEFRAHITNFFRFLVMEEGMVKQEYILGSSEKLKENLKTLLDFLENVREKVDEDGLTGLLWIANLFHIFNDTLRKHYETSFEYDMVLKKNHNLDLNLRDENPLLENEKIRNLLKNILKLDEIILKNIKELYDASSNFKKKVEK
jgi:hypothetical protein